MVQSLSKEMDGIFFISVIDDGITAGADNAIWFIEHNGNRIGRITVTGEVKEFPVPVPEAGLSVIASGPEGSYGLQNKMYKSRVEIHPAFV